MNLTVRVAARPARLDDSADFGRGELGRIEALSRFRAVRVVSAEDMLAVQG